MDRVVHQDRQLEVDPLSHGQPGESAKDRRYAFIFPRARDEACCGVLHSLKALEENVGDAVQDRIAVVES